MKSRVQNAYIPQIDNNQYSKTLNDNFIGNYVSSRQSARHRRAILTSDSALSNDCPSQSQSYPSHQQNTEDTEFVVSEYFNETYYAKSKESLENYGSIKNVAKLNTIQAKKSPREIFKKPANINTYNSKYTYMVILNFIESTFILKPILIQLVMRYS